MAKPYRSLPAIALVGTFAVLMVLSPAQLLAQPSQQGGEPLPAPPLGLETRVTVFPPLHGADVLQSSADKPKVALPPVIEGPNFLEPWTQAGSGLDAELLDQALSPVVAVPSVISEPAEPLMPPPTTALTVTLDWYLNPQHATLLIAREKGMFGRRGLDVTLVTPADPSVTTKLLAAGRTDLAVGRQPQLHALADKGMPLVRVATLLAAPVSGLLIRDSLGSEHDVSAFEGLRIGFTDIDGRDVFLASMLKELLRVDDALSLVELQNVNYSVLDAMREQQIDAVLVHHRNLLPRQLADEGVSTRVLPIEQSGLPAHDGLILMANRDQLNGKRDAMRRFVEALEEAALWIVNHPTEAWTLLEVAEPALAEQSSRDSWDDIIVRLALQPAAVDQGRYRRLEQYLLQAGFIETATPLEQLAIDLGAQFP